MLSLRCFFVLGRAEEGWLFSEEYWAGVGVCMWRRARACIWRGVAACARVSRKAIPLAKSMLLRCALPRSL